MLTLKYHLDPEYVLDRMEMYEIAALMEYEWYAKKDEWEIGRMQAYVQAQTQSTKRLKPDDIMKLPWEDKFIPREEKDTYISDEDVERLTEKANNIAGRLFQKKDSEETGS